VNSPNERRARRLARLTQASLLSLALVACARPSPPAPRPSVGHFGPVTLEKRTSPLLPANSTNTVVLAMGAGITGDRVSGLLEIPSDQCAVIIARAGASIEDVDLDAYGEDGSIVGTDAGPDKTPALLVCPPHPARVWVSARIASGHGLVAVGAERLLPADAGRAAAVYGIHSEVDPSEASASGWPDLDERLQAHRRDIGGSWQDVRRVAVPLDARLPTRISAQVDAGRCVDAFVAPAEEVGHLELNVLDSTGAILGRAPSGGRDRGVVVCSPLATSLTLELRPQSGRGVGVFALSRSREGSEGEIESDAVRIEAFPELELGAELAKLESELSLGNGYGRGKRTLTGSVEVGRRSTQTLKLAAGCSRLDVQGAKPLRGLEATLWSASGELVARGWGGGRATLFACVGAGAYRLDLEATLRPGPFALVVHTESDVPSALSNNPLAAGRLLSQVVSRGVLRRPGEVGQVTAFDLSDSELKFMELTVPFGRCMDVALGLDKNGLGAEVRLVALASGAEVALGRGAHAASARVCSLDAASSQANIKTRVELRVAAGAGKGLVATRMLSPTR
jgi:hypothetical protein